MSKEQSQGFSPGAPAQPEPMSAEAASEEPNENQMALLQQIYQQKQMEILNEFQRAQANLTLQMQQLNCFQLIQQIQQQQQQPQQSVSQIIQQNPNNVAPVTEVATTESEASQMSPSSRSEGHSGRVRRSLHRSLSGSSQTISQTTKDRLKTMIALKKNRTRTDTKAVVSANAGTSPTWTQTAVPSSSSAGWTGSESPVKQCSSGGSSVLTASVPTITVAVSSPHYEPYPLPSTAHSNRTAALPPEHQLRKVNSEPNLKMRIRAKLLSKGSSPIQAHQGSAFSFPHPPLVRSESDVPMDTDVGSGVLVQTPTLLTPAHLLQSPSLPNLIGEQLQMDMSALLAQAQFSPFFSMPSLYKNSIGTPGCSTWGSGAVDSAAALSEGCSRNAGKFDPRNLGSLPAGGYQSLLKQQIRDLVLRRKSLVREEPEDEATLEAQLLSRLTNGAIMQMPSVISTPNKTGLVYDSTMAKHQCICGDNKRHVEHGGRVHSIWARLHERGLVDRCERVVIRKASLDTLRTMHSYNYVTFFALSPTAFMKAENSQIPVKSFVQLPCGGLGIDTDTYFNDNTTPLAIKIAVGSLIELASQVAEGKLRNGFACIRPPGHHAEYDQAMGFCFFNNVAIAVKHLQQRYREQSARIAIIDWDVHHGNGTQSFFDSDPSVLYLSLHRHDNGNFFPGTGAVTEVGSGPGKGFTVNVPFSGDAMSDADYLAAWRVVVTPILDCFQPTFIMVSAGFDAARGHTPALGGYNLTPQIFGYFTRQLMAYAGGRVVLALEGGYDLAAISDSAEECVKVLCGDFPDAGKLSVEALSTIPKLSAQEAIQKAVAIHKKHWPILNGAHGIGISELHWQTIAQRFASLSV